MKKIVIFACMSVAACGAPEKSIDAQSYKVATGEDWPFTVPRGTIGCDKIYPYFQAEGDSKRYALNGTARAKYPYVDPLLRINVEMTKMMGSKGPGDVARYDPAGARKMARDMCDA